MTADQLTNDIQQKARMTGVHVAFDVPPFEAYYSPHTREVHAQEIRDWGLVAAPDASFVVHETPDVAYFVALHELGHAQTLPPGVPRYRADGVEVLHYEAAAWEWAMENSAIPITARMREMAVAALVHYRETSDGFAREYPPAQYARTMEKLTELAVAA
ncbi:MAG: hypothetical protein KGL39_29835 [Patescibacteria group bacterium]|nr:hypothetical protein [Patescibacteria group bacterium]